ncbi:hypothetical protein P154DRAFT_615233 [Amniculicola lignicola CBS 123094]|uniref:Uncharacterized protein n=1 Tax=Amniculicola lignicola CBS 123094 TaxID=1392246 RepID=A0A6A5WXR0_9PLEO|nr:hypothetical protein P154DRAFT_615233 [Amniculicola lignicola CBS 123094]
MASSTLTAVQLRLLPRVGSGRHHPSDREISTQIIDNNVISGDTDPNISFGQVGIHVDGNETPPRGTENETSTQVELGNSATSNDTSTNAVSNEVHHRVVVTSNGHPSNTIKLEWSYAKAATVMAVILALIFGAGSWVTQNYANRLARTSTEIARYELCADHEELRNTPKCREVMAETLYALGLSDMKTHDHLRRKTPADIVRIVDERMSSIAQFLVDSTHWMPRQVEIYSDIITFISRTEASHVIHEDVKKKVHRLRYKSNWACSRLFWPGGQSMKTKIANGTINEIGGLYQEVLGIAMAADSNMTMTTTERMQLANLVSGGFTSYNSRPGLDAASGFMEFG